MFLCHFRSRIILGLLSAFVLLVPAEPGFAKPARQARPYVVVLDPGHGGPDTGAISPDGKLMEKNMNLEVANAVALDLQTAGFKVYLTRTHDQPVNTPPRDWNRDGKLDPADELNARTVFANRHHADIFISIHFDGSSDPSIRGTHGFYCPARPFWRSSQRLSELLTNSVVAHLRESGYADANDGVETDVADIVPQEWPDYPWFITLGPSRKHRVVATKMPGALIETLYMSSRKDDSAMRRPADIRAIAQGYADGIKAYFGGNSHR